jgi:hypothetical protein
METYQMLIVFSDHGKKQLYYVVNIATKKIQSSWNLELEARRVCKSLNGYESLLNKKKSI